MKDQFKDKANTWDSVPWKNKLADESYEKIKSFMDIKSDWSIIDIGGGTGLFSLKFLDDVSNITVIDTSKGMLNVLREKIEANNIKNVDIVFSEFNEKTISPKKYDLVISMMTLHHIENLDVLFEDVYMSLNSGGKIAFIDLQKEDGDFHRKGAQYIYNGFEEEFINKKLKVSGFKSINIKAEFCVSKLTDDGENKDYPILLITAEK